MPVNRVPGLIPKAQARKGYQQAKNAAKKPGVCERCGKAGEPVGAVGIIYPIARIGFLTGITTWMLTLTGYPPHLCQHCARVLGLLVEGWWKTGRQKKR